MRVSQNISVKKMNASEIFGEKGKSQVSFLIIGIYMKMVKLKDGIYLEELDDAAVLLDTMTERVAVLADEEKNILNALLCKGVEDVIEEMLKKYDGDKEIIEQDIRKFIEKLRENGFVEIAEE